MPSCAKPSCVAWEWLFRWRYSTTSLPPTQSSGNFLPVSFLFQSIDAAPAAVSDALCAGLLANNNSDHGAPSGRRIFKLQILRAVACNIVKHRDFYPTKEVLLKHSMSYLGMFDEFKGASAYAPCNLPSLSACKEFCIVYLHKNSTCK